MSEFTKYAKQARERGDSTTARRIETEGKIVSKLIRHGLASGYTVSVYDGEEWTVKRSTSYNEILNACFTTDSDNLRFRDAAGHTVGTVMLVYGSDGNDVISDYASSDLDAFDVWIKPINDYANKL